MSYNTVWEQQGIVWTYGGHVTAREIEQANEAFYNDDRSERARYQIIDALRVRSVEWNDRNIKVAAAYDIGAETVVKHVKVAYVATAPDIIAKMEKYVELARTLNATWQFRGFRDLAAARAWVAS